MEQKETNKILDCIENIYLKSEDKELKPAIFQELDSDLEILSGYFNSTKQEAFFLANTFAYNLERGCSVAISDYAKHFKCSSINILRYRFIFESLLDKNLLYKEHYNHRRNEIEYSINKAIYNIIVEQRDIPTEIEDSVKDIFDFLESLENLVEQRSNETITTEELLSKTEILLYQDKDFPLLKMVLGYQLPIIDTCFLLLAFWKKISEDENLELYKAANSVLSKKSRKIRYLQSILNNENKLIENNLLIVQTEESYRKPSFSLTLSALSLKMLEESGLKEIIPKN